MNRMNDNFRVDSNKSPHQLEREIDATRAELMSTLEELEHRLSPSDLLNQFVGQVRRHGGEFGGNLGQSLKDHPLPALLTSIGIAWMMAANGRQHNGSASMSGARTHNGNGRMRKAGRRLRERMHDVRDSVRTRGEGAREGVVHARERMSSSTQSMRERSRSMSSSARYRAQRARSGFSDMLEEQPLLLGALGLAAGAIAGAALPPTEQEDRAFGPARDRALDRAKRAGAEGARHARERVEETAESTKAAMRGDSGTTPAEHTATGERPEVSSPGTTQTSSPGTGLGY